MSLDTNIRNLTLRAATEAKALRTLINGNAADLSALTTASKANLVAAINELAGMIGEGSPTTLNDLTDVALTGPGSGQIIRHNGTEWVNVAGTDHFEPAGAVAAAIANLLDSAPGALDTLNELAAALGDDPNFASTVTSSLAQKQPLDADLTAIAALASAANTVPYATGSGAWALATFTAFARTLLDDPDAATARGTLDVWSKAEVGPVDTDYVAIYDANLLAP